MRKTVLTTLLLFAMGALALCQADQKMGSKPASGKNTEQALKGIEDKWAAASLKNDADAIASIVADDWTATNASGKVQTKAEMLDETKKAKLTKSSVGDMKVKSLGADTAVVTGTWTGLGVGGDGKKVDTTERWTDVFVKRNGKWQAVASQSTTVKK